MNRLYKPEGGLGDPRWLGGFTQDELASGEYLQALYPPQDYNDRIWPHILRTFLSWTVDRFNNAREPEVPINWQDTIDWEKYYRKVESQWGIKAYHIAPDTRDPAQNARRIKFLKFMHAHSLLPEKNPDGSNWSRMWDDDYEPGMGILSDTSESEPLGQSSESSENVHSTTETEPMEISDHEPEAKKRK